MDTGYLSQQVTTIIERLHGFFDEIGVPSHERDSRESEVSTHRFRQWGASIADTVQLFSALSETLHNQLNVVAKEKHDLTEQAQSLIKIIRQMERSLDDSLPKDDFESERDGLKVTFPLMNCIQRLKEKHHTISKLHRERFEEVKKLAEALHSYSSHLEPSFIKVKLPPMGANAQVTPSFDLSATYFEKLDTELNRVYQEYNKRVAIVSQCASDIINLWSELGTPQAQVDSLIVQHARDSPEQLGLHQDDLKRLAAKRDKLVNEKQQRERKLKELRTTVESLWDRLGVEESERKQFLAANRGCGLRQINEFEDELSRLNELKRQNLHIFVEDARFKLQELWDSLYFSEEEMMEFTPAFSDVYSDALLSAHEQEISRLDALKEQRGPILAAVDKHRSLIQDREDLEKSSQDASRLMSKGQKGERRDPGKLLREEKMRKRIAKELPKVEAELRKTLEGWEHEYGRPFCVHGERYLDELGAGPVKAAPPRSKTPVASHSVREAPKSASRATASTTRGRAGTTVAAPAPRSKTPTATIGRREMATAGTASVMMSASNKLTASAKLSPSKIPGASRLPMSSLRDGNNSPERRAANLARSQTAAGYYHDDSSRTIRPNLNPPRAPPPKMKELCIPPTPTPSGNKENGHGDPDHSAAIVRHVSPDDPYDDARYRSLHSSTPQQHPPFPRSTTSQDSFQSRPMSRQDYPMAPPSRQASNTSSVMSGSVAASSAISGSENWETYTDNSETDEADATEAYYAKIQAQQQQQHHHSSGHARLPNAGSGGTSSKRPATAMGGAAKRLRDHHQQHTILEEATIVEGVDGDGWTDEGNVVETF